MAAMARKPGAKDLAPRQVRTVGSGHVNEWARCTAMSKQRREQCLNPALPGAFVCRFHGGATAQALEGAQRRLRLMLPPMLQRLFDLAHSADDRVALAAVKHALALCGLSEVHRTESRVAVHTELDTEIAELLSQFAARGGPPAPVDADWSEETGLDGDDDDGDHDSDDDDGDGTGGSWPRAPHARSSASAPHSSLSGPAQLSPPRDS